MVIGCGDQKAVGSELQIRDPAELIRGSWDAFDADLLDAARACAEGVVRDIVGIDLDDDWEDILTQLTQTVYTRMPVFRETIDQVEGLLHIRTVIAKLALGGLTFEDLQRSVQRPYFIPEGTALTQQLLEFQRRERRMGLVVDEYGDIQGLVTLDDILEEIVGEYTAESRAKTRDIRLLDDGNFVRRRVDQNAAAHHHGKRKQVDNAEFHGHRGFELRIGNPQE